MRQLEKLKKEGEDRRLVSKFEAEHSDEISEIPGVIDYIDKGYVKERFPEIYKYKINSFLKSIALVTQSNEGIINLIISKS